ncbi:MAG TPA: MOSC N-terminal beta barrel domain-containing protein [Candidatus Angelobacter sp.]
MRIAELWRYPVKSMGGEKLQCATLDSLGVQGDRVVHVEDSRGRFITSRTHPRLLGHHAKLDSAGEPVVDNLSWTEPQVLQQVIEIAGPDARLVRDDSAQRFDILPLLVATDGAITAFGRDGRRLRPNIVVGGVDGLEERSWEGKCLRIGKILIGIEDLRMRCVMTTYDPDTLKQDRDVLRDIVRRFDGKLALNCWVIQGGEICVGDKVNLVENCEREKAIAGHPE